MMNIVYLVSDLRAAGPTNQAFNLMTGLAKIGVNAWIVTLYEEQEDSWYERFVAAKVNVYQLHADHKHLFSAVRKLEKFIIDNKISILHSSGMSADFVNRLIKADVVKVNTIRQEFGALAEGKNYITKLITRLITISNHRAMDVRVACSKSLQGHLNNYSKLNYECVENGVDVEKYDMVDINQKNAIREKLGISKDSIVFLSVGVLYTRKQTLLMAKTFLNSNIPNAVLLVVGDGVEMDNLKLLAKMNPQIILVGKVIDPLQYYHCADIFVSASLAEGLPNTVMEAMACGLPCILSDIGPHKEILEYEPNAGAMFCTGDYQKLEREFKKSQNWDLKMKSECAHRLVYENLSKYCTAKKYNYLYKQNTHE